MAMNETKVKARSHDSMPLCHLFGHTTKNKLNPNHIRLPGSKPIHNAFFFPSGAPLRATVITMDFADGGEEFWPNKDTFVVKDVDLSSLPISAFRDGVDDFTHVYDPERKFQPKSHAKEVLTTRQISECFHGLVGFPQLSRLSPRHYWEKYSGTSFTTRMGLLSRILR